MWASVPQKGIQNHILDQCSTFKEDACAAACLCRFLTSPRRRDPVNPYLEQRFRVLVWMPSFMLASRDSPKTSLSQPYLSRTTEET